MFSLEENMQNSPENESVQKKANEEKDEKTQRWVNFILAVIVTVIIIAATDNSLILENTRSNSNFSRYISGAFALQLFPLLFGWIARQINPLQKYWIPVYWLVLLLVLIARGILISNIVSR